MILSSQLCQLIRIVFSSLIEQDYLSVRVLQLQLVRLCRRFECLVVVVDVVHLHPLLNSRVFMFHYHFFEVDNLLLKFLYLSLCLFIVLDLKLKFGGLKLNFFSGIAKFHFLVFLLLDLNFKFLLKSHIKAHLLFSCLGALRSDQAESAQTQFLHALVGPQFHEQLLGLESQLGRMVRLLLVASDFALDPFEVVGRVAKFELHFRLISRQICDLLPKLNLLLFFPHQHPVVLCFQSLNFSLHLCSNTVNKQFLGTLLAVI